MSYRLQEENTVLGDYTEVLRTRVSSLELETMDLRDIQRESSRARARAEARVSSLFAQSHL